MQLLLACGLFSPYISGMPGADEESLLKKCTIKKQFKAMVKFIEDPNNFAIIEGICGILERRLGK